MEMHGVRYPAEAILPWLIEADLTHISNEVSFYEDCPFPDPNQRAIFFCSAPDYIELFEYIDADIIELTGNHNNDSWYAYGVDVVPFSLNLYRERDMVYYGGGENLADAFSPALISHNGNNLAFIGCNAGGPDYAWATADRGGSAPCSDYQWMAQEVTRLREAGYLPIVTFQYYENYSNIPGESQILHFGWMAEAGAAIVNGSQAHRPKGMAFSEDAFIDYGLGNLFFDQMGVTIDGNLIEQTRWEIIQRHTFYDGRHLNTQLLTAMLEDYAQPRPMTPAERLRFLSELFTASGWNNAVK
jgi:poly-gamma-glutamate synthesis protein (capsule biosynthesis protein)